MEPIGRISRTDDLTLVPVRPDGQHRYRPSSIVTVWCGRSSNQSKARSLTAKASSWPWVAMWEDVAL